MRNYFFIALIFIISCQAKKEEIKEFQPIDFPKYQLLEILEYTYDSDSFPGIKDILKEKDQIQYHLLINGTDNFNLDTNHFSTNRSFSACFQPHHSLILHDKKTVDTIDICFSCGNFSFNNGPTRELKNQNALIKALNNHGLNISENN